MFSSQSSCAPNSRVSTYYTAKTNHTLSIGAEVDVYVNFEFQPQRPITVLANQRVEAVVTSPPNFLGYQFYTYLIDDQQSTFAVVNKNLYTPVVRPDAITKKWYNYINFSAQISFYNSVPEEPFYLTGFGRGLIDVDSLHCILDPLNECIYFYSTSQENICRVILPAGPIEYKKVISTTPQGTYTQDLLVLCSDYKIYRIKFDRRYYASNEFKPAPTPFFILDDLPFQEDIPGSGSFLDMARKRVLKNLFPVVTALDVIGNEIYIAGKSDIFVVDINFTLLRKYSVAGEIIQCLSCFYTGAIVTTRSQKVIYATPGSVSEFYQGTALGVPAAINNNQRVVVPDIENRRLLVFYNTTGSYTIWNTDDFCPAYARSFNNKLFVTGHESLMALEFTNDNTYRTYTFKEKVTLVSSVDYSLVGIHYLTNRQVLDLTGIKKVIPFDVEPRTGPLTHIGTNPVQVTMLGQEGVMPVSGPGITVWTNGISNEPISTGDWVSVSYRATNTGQVRSAFVIGENAFDYDVVVINSIKMEDFYSTQVAINAISTPDYSILTPNYGNIITGITGPITIDFPWVSWQQSFANITVTTDGRVNFGNVTDLSANTVIGSAMVDAIYAVNRDLYQGLPVNNVNPNNITLGILDSLETPGVYVSVQDLDEFRGLRFRWVGTSMSSYPLGNTLPVWSTTNNHNEIPVDNLASVKINDYVSGNNITVSTQVTGLIVYKDQTYFRIIDTVTNSIILNSYPNPLPLNFTVPKTYSNIILDNQVQGRVSNFFVDTYNGNQLGYSILSVKDNQIIVNKQIDANISSEYEIGFANPIAFPPGISIAEMRRDIVSISRQSKTVTCLIYYSDQRIVLVNSSDFDKVYAKQTVNGTGIPTDTTILSKNQINKQITIVVDRTQAVEGNVIQGNLVTINVTTVNVPDGRTISYNISGSGITSQDFFGEPSLTGTVTVNTNQAQLTLLPNLDAITEGTESVSVTFGSISDIVPSSVTVNFDILDIGETQSIITTATTSITEYHIRLSSASSVSTGDVLTLESTLIEFSQSTKIAEFCNFIYATIRRVFCDRPITVTTPGIVKFQGNFAVVNQSLSVYEHDPILFKANVAHPSFAYEVGLYSGLNFQFVEVFYDSANHSSANRLSINSADNSQSASTLTQANKSYLFGSIAQSGRWRLLGAGSFTNINQGFVPRNVRMITAPAFDNSWLRFEFTLEQKVPTTSNVMLALSYGRLSVNSGLYQGYSNNNQFESWNIQDGDFVVIELPFNRSRQPIAPIFSIGEYQIAVPAIAQDTYSVYSQQTQLFVDQPTQVYRTGNVTIAATGRYVIPEYYRSAFGFAGRPVKYFRNRMGLVTQLIGLYHELIVGDIITIQDIRTSTRKYDIRDAVIVGPETYRLAYRTQGDPLFDVMTWPTLVEPFVRQLEYGNVILWYEGEPAYYSTNLTLTANTSISSRLLLKTSDVDFFVNGSGSYGQYLTSVSTGANIEMRWAVPTYFESNTIVYQVLTDYDTSNIYVPVGLWPIQNRVVINQTDVVRPAMTKVDTDSDIIKNTIPMFIDDLAPNFYPGEIIVTPGVIDNEFVNNITSFGNTISADRPELETQINELVDSDFVKADFRTIGVVQPEFIEQNFFTDEIDQADLPEPQTLINDSVIREYIEYNVIMPEIVVNELQPLQTEILRDVGVRFQPLATHILGTVDEVFFNNIPYKYFYVGPKLLTIESRMPFINLGKLLVRANTVEFPIIQMALEFRSQPYKRFTITSYRFTAKEIKEINDGDLIQNTLYYYFARPFNKISYNNYYTTNYSRLFTQFEETILPSVFDVSTVSPKILNYFPANVILADQYAHLSNPWETVKNIPTITSDLLFDIVEPPETFSGYIGFETIDINNVREFAYDSILNDSPNFLANTLEFYTGGLPGQIQRILQDYDLNRSSSDIITNVTPKYNGVQWAAANIMTFAFDYVNLIEFNANPKHYFAGIPAEMAMSFKKSISSNFQLQTSRAESRSGNQDYLIKYPTVDHGNYNYSTIKYPSEVTSINYAKSVEPASFGVPSITVITIVTGEPIMVKEYNVATSDVGDPLWENYNIHSGLSFIFDFRRFTDTIQLTEISYELVSTSSSRELPIDHEFFGVNSVKVLQHGFEFDRPHLIKNAEFGYQIDSYSLYPYRLDFTKFVENFNTLSLNGVFYKDHNFYFSYPAFIDFDPIWSTDRLTESGAFRTDIQAYYLKDYRPYNYEITKQFTLTVNDTEVFEGQSLNFVVTTTGITDGLKIPYSITGFNVVSDDFIPAAKLSGELTIFGGRAQINLVVASTDGGQVGYYEEFEFRLIGVTIGTQKDLVARVRINEIGNTPLAAGVTPFSISTDQATGETVYYTEGTNAALQLGHWDRSEILTQTIGGLGPVICHGPGSGDFTFSIPNLPLHKQLRYQVFWHFVDSTDGEVNYIYIDNEVWAEFSKIGYGSAAAPPVITYSKFASVTWVPATYSYTPWADITGEDSKNGYLVFDTGLFNHTGSGISVKHRLFQPFAGSFANFQGPVDEAMYLSHVRLSYVPERPSYKAQLDEFISFEKSYVAAPGAFDSLASVTEEITKYVSAVPFRIPGTNFYNMRILFNTMFYAVPSVPDSYFYKYGTEIPEYTMTVNSTEITEGETLEVKLSTIGVNDNTLVPYRIAGENIYVGDFTNITSLTGNFIIQDNQATLSFVTKSSDGGYAGYYEKFMFELPTIKDANNETLKVAIRLNEEETKPTTPFKQTYSVTTASPANVKSYFGDPVPLPEFFANLGTELKYQHVDPGDVAQQTRPMRTPRSTPKYNIARRHRFPILWYIRGG